MILVRHAKQFAHRRKRDPGGHGRGEVALAALHGRAEQLPGQCLELVVQAGQGGRRESALDDLAELRVDGAIWCTADRPGIPTGRPEKERRPPVETIYNDFDRPDAGLLVAFREVLNEYSPSCLVTDARRRVGAIGGLLPVLPHHKVTGPALTVNLDIDDLVDCMPVLARAQPGDIIVVACHGTTRTAMWGGLMSTLSMKAGITAGIVDGAIRDVDEIRELGFPVWYRGTVPRPSPTALHGRTEPVQVNVPVIVNGQVIEPGDILVADENGIAVVPVAVAKEVVEGTHRQIEKERLIREKINSGATVRDLLAEFGHL